MGLGCTHYGLILKNSSSFRQISQTCSWMNFVCTWPSVFVNVALIITFATSRERRNPCIVLLTNLTTIDLLNGFVNMPMFFFIYREFGEGRYPCSFVLYAVPVFIMLNAASFATVTLISLERYLSVFHPYYYRSKLSLKNTSICVGLSWLFAFLVNLTFILLAHSGALQGIFSVVVIAGILVNMFCYFKILLKARQLRFQIHNIAARLGHGNLSLTDKRYVTVGALIILSMIICFLPIFVDSFSLSFDPKEGHFVNTRCLGWTLAMSNSIINPMITCSFCPAVRRKVVKILTFRVLCRKAEQWTRYNELKSHPATYCTKVLDLVRISLNHIRLWQSVKRRILKVLNARLSARMANQETAIKEKLNILECLLG